MKSTEHTLSRWEKTTEPPSFPPLSGSTSAEVCIVGAGIAGLTAAYLLAREGHDVLVLDREGVGAGETGQTSAHLSAVMDASFQRLTEVHGEDSTQKVHASHADSIDLIEDIVTRESIACDFLRVPGFLFAAQPGDGEWLRNEMQAVEAVGAGGTWIEAFSPLGPTGPAIRFDRQAEIHPLKYLHGLAAAARAAGVRICNDTEVSGISETDSGVTVTTAVGTVKAQQVVVSTNYPITLWLGALPRLAAYRTYVIGLRIAEGAIRRGVYWDTAEPYHYVRIAGSGDGQVLLVGGEDHRTGQEKHPARRFDALEEWIRARLPAAGEVVDRWSGQFLSTPDGLGYLGLQPGSDRIHVITGDCGQGLTNGTVGAMLVRDVISGRPTPLAEVYAPERTILHTPLETARENFATVSQYADLVFRSDVGSEEEIEPGSGAVLREGLKPVAVYRDEQGRLHRHSALCTHLGCVVRWNGVEQSWDCPCHGSRFDPAGEVLTGPAVTPLEAIDE